ncbi:RagB/SusD family nutrient uptake outer membrane protein [Parapedobacter indicus]|uniref:Uncaracterized surface protein containing fasciclin (FAS1) repeats n=1 Tax=Parapedobacter indicus TaxID=1477437 RepID=A0A1I3KIR0_9SPHI|nr:RagB/SusD family nutrient uptake outer membrane protein [Parapedobacter indicus]PPL01833.1 putative surface protein with fasciclin (FAS1) repeats [Parapedobacter indicus]SFI72337.1 Uncaracterized surface protein containing fasciclin (FAS1) repeats [Parapedobacter indicus]
MKFLNRVAIAVVILSFAFGCKKDPVTPPEEPREPEEVIGNVISNLETADTISVFVDALKGLELSATDVEEGITVFAPLNDDEARAQQARMMGSKRSSIQAFGTEDLTSSVLKDHIVKGVIKLADLTNDRMLTSLSGKELKVSRVGKKIWINGVQIGSDEIGATDDQVVYTVKTLLSGTSVDDELQTTSLEVVVWDATAWTPEKPKGVRAESGTVWLYASQEDYANSVVAYEAAIDTGKAIFEDIKAGTYYVEVEYGDKYNIFYEGEEAQDGYYFGMAAAGIFQSQSDVDGWAEQPDAAVGNFKWTDSNSDGVINAGDMVKMPYENAEIKDGRVKTVEIFVGYDNNAAQKPLTLEEFDAQLNTAHDRIGGWQKELAVADALLGGEAVSDTLGAALNGQFGPLNNFSFTPAVPVINQLWQGGYSVIHSLNAIESRAPQAAELGTLRLFRAYIYMQLMHYFGKVPLLTVETQGASLSNSDPDAVYNFIVAELEQVSGQLPQQAADGGVSKGAAQALLAKAALFKGNFQLAITLTDQIIASGAYALAANTTQIFKPSGSEVIWDHSETMREDIKRFFYNRSVFPIIRYTEVMLMNAEAKAASGKLTEAGQVYNQLASRRGIPPIGEAVSAQAFADQLHTLWRIEMPKEGGRFVNLVRWHKAAEELGSKGYMEGKSNVLPIPQVVIDANPGMLQNSGY